MGKKRIDKQPPPRGEEKLLKKRKYSLRFNEKISGMGLFEKKLAGIHCHHQTKHVKL